MEREYCEKSLSLISDFIAILSFRVHPLGIEFIKNEIETKDAATFVACATKTKQYENITGHYIINIIKNLNII